MEAARDPEKFLDHQVLLSELDFRLESVHDIQQQPLLNGKDRMASITSSAIVSRMSQKQTPNISFYKSQEEQSCWNFYKDSTIYGLSVSMTGLDFVIMTFVIRFFLSTTEHTELAASFGYANAYQMLTVVTLNNGVVQSLSQKISEFMAKKRYLRFGELFWISVLVSMAYTTIFSIIPGLYLEQIMRKLGVQEELLEKIVSLV